MVKINLTLRDQTQILFLEHGGNGSLIHFFEEYNITDNIDISIKYQLNAVDYYRKLVS